MVTSLFKISLSMNSLPYICICDNSVTSKVWTTICNEILWQTQMIYLWNQYLKFKLVSIFTLSSQNCHTLIRSWNLEKNLNFPSQKICHLGPQWGLPQMMMMHSTKKSRYNTVDLCLTRVTLDLYSSCPIKFQHKADDFI